MTFSHRTRACDRPLFVSLLLSTLLPCALPGSAGAQPAAAASPRPRIGVALGGGSARGLAHVGVLRWLEENRVPIDAVTGTSMGGLIGGSYAVGMTPAEIETFLGDIDWDAMFGGSAFQYANVRRKRDGRIYPSHLEFGLRRRVVLPPSLNSGQQVDLMLAGLTAHYYGIASFDDLPTPFRCVAVDLKTARPIVLQRGSLAMAMRATMSLPAVFPPVTLDDQYLIDGGVMNNIPADVARAMGADRVIAVNVGDLADPDALAASMLGILSETLDAMMRANTLRALAAADIVINVPVKQYGSLDWRRYGDLIREGYDAAERMRSSLIAYAVDEPTWEAWRAARAARRRTTLPAPAFLDVTGAGSSDEAVIRRALEPSIGQPIDLEALDATITELGGLSRYASLTWQFVSRDGQDGLRISANPKAYGPPFLYLALSLENTSGSDFRFGLAARYLSYDLVGSGSELRFDAGVGSDPHAALALYRPLWSSMFFVDPIVYIGAKSLRLVDEGNVVASYRQTRSGAGLHAGFNPNRLNEIRLGAEIGRVDASVEIGDPTLPEVGGKESSAFLQWTHDGQDSPIVPSRGLYARTSMTHILDAPDLPGGENDDRTSVEVSQLEGTGSHLWSWGFARRNRVFVSGGAGTSFDGRPLPTNQFSLGGPLRLSAFTPGEMRGDHYMQLTGGYLRQVSRLPDFLGGPIFLGGWIEGGSAFNEWSQAEVEVHFSTGLIADTLIGPVFTGVSVSADGASRFYLGIGRIFQ
jgi:NTE family protein